jgi:hypothetical protein
MSPARQRRRMGQSCRARRCGVALLFLVIACGRLDAARHPFHVSIAQAEVALDERGTKVLQVALRVDPADLEAALEARTKQPIHLETTPRIDDLIVAYLDDVVQVRHPAATEGGKPTPLEPCPPPPLPPPPPPDTNAGADGRATPPARIDDPESKKPTSIIRWVGKDLEDIRYAWLHFEVCLPESGIVGLDFSNRILFEVEPEQVNTINIRDGEERFTLRFTPADVWKVLRRPPGANRPDR